MDYEKAYNEALERARKIHNEILDNEILGFPDQIREIFPELRGSEDERIRKWLVDYFSSIKKTVWIHRDITCEQILAWLEKQKPMYNLEIPAGDVAPAEEEGPFDEDEFLENELSAFLQNYDKEYDDDAAVSDVARHFYEIGKKQKEQKPAWSEEDVDMLNSCISSIEEAKENRYAYKETDGDTSYDYEIAWLKSLRPITKK